MMKRKQTDIKFLADIHGAEMKGSNAIDVDKNFDKLKGIGINILEE